MPSPWFLAVLETLNVEPALTAVAVVVNAVSTRSDADAALTVTVNVRLALAGGVALSATWIVTLCVPTCAAVGVHVKRPDAALMAAPVGGVTRLYVSVWAGRSASVPAAVSDRSVPALTVRAVIAARAGAVFTSVTATVKLACAVPDALSVTRIVTGKLPGPALSPGVQVKTPVVGLIVAPVGAVTRL